MKYFLLICSMALALSCKKEPEEEIENDVITTIKITVNDTTTGVAPADYFFRDLDGEGGNDPVTDTFLLQSNKYYEIQLDLSNERQTPAQSVTDEINANKEVHQLFYDASPSAFQNFMYKDFDANGKPVGLKICFITQNSAASGTIEIVLRHFPNKNGVNVSSGDITNAVGESEVEIDFPFKIQ